MNRRAFLLTMPVVAVLPKLLPSMKTTSVGYVPMKLSIPFEALYGGAAGGGKSSILTYKMLKEIHREPKKVWAFMNLEQEKFYRMDLE